MILSAQDHRDLMEAVEFARKWSVDNGSMDDAARYYDLVVRLKAHPIATTAVIQAVPTARAFSGD